RGKTPLDPPLLAPGVLVCGLCGQNMYRYPAIGKRKDGSRRVNEYYRCRSHDRRLGDCEARAIPARDIEGWLDTQFTTGIVADQDVLETATVPGHGHEDEIMQVEQDIRDLDLDDPAFDAKLAAMREERARLRALPSVPDQQVSHPTGEKYGEVWQRLDKLGRRKFLLDHSARITALRTTDQEQAERGEVPRLVANLDIAVL
ncbi:MAG TPA: zinc ribbon domain-containing protein, partial [Edaphobacter sp.]|nr:zinc ribbon domain-containing protein [Edaphobacter sp.]